MSVSNQTGAEQYVFQHLNFRRQFQLVLLSSLDTPELFYSNRLLTQLISRRDLVSLLIQQIVYKSLIQIQIYTPILHFQLLIILMSEAPQYLHSVQSKTKRQVNYNLRLSQYEYTQQSQQSTAPSISSKLRDSFKKMKSYYSNASVGVPGASNTQSIVPVEYEYEVQAMFPSLASVAAIGGGGAAVNSTANILHIKSSVSFNFKRGAAGNNQVKNNVYSLAELPTVPEKLEFFTQLLEHLLDVFKEASSKSSFANNLEPAMLNLHPTSLLRLKTSQILLTDFFLPACNQLSSDPSSPLGLWYLAQMSPEQISEGKCDNASLVWQLSCLLYHIMTEQWPFLSSHIGAIRRNVLLQRYSRYPDESIQSAIFDRVFIEGKRLSMLEILTATKNLIKTMEHSSQKPIQTKMSQDRAGMLPAPQDVSQRQLQFDYDHPQHGTPMNHNNDNESEVIEEDYYDEEEQQSLQQQSARRLNKELKIVTTGLANKKHKFVVHTEESDKVSAQNVIKKQYSPSPDKNFDESHVSSSEEDVYGDRSVRDSQALPLFENLPSVRSKITDQSQLQQLTDRSNNNDKLTQNRLELLNKDYRAPDFDNLPSMRSSVNDMSAEKKNVSNAPKEPVSKFNFNNAPEFNASETSFSEQSYKIEIKKKGDKIYNAPPQNPTLLKNMQEEQKERPRTANAAVLNQESESSFLHSARQSEKSMVQNSRFGDDGGFMDDQSSIHQQQQDTEMNVDDQIGFLVLINENSVLGITIESGQFIYFTYDQPAVGKKAGPSHIQLTLQNEQDCQLGGFRQVISVQSRRPKELFIIATTENAINVFQLNYPNIKEPQISLLKCMKLVADCICVSYEEPQFYVATQNKIAKVLIDPNPGPKCLVSKQKHKFYESDQVKATAMAFSVLKGNEDDGELEAFMGVATSEFSFVIMRLTKQTHQEIVAVIEQVHQNDITQVLTLTDNFSSLSFVTLSLDQQLKVFSFDGELEYESVADGQIITGVVVPQKRDYFIISTFNEETNISGVSVYRKQKLLFRIGAASHNEETVLDLKISGNQLFMPRGMSNVEKVEIKGL